MNAIISIKPIYVERIKNRTKKFEYRKKGILKAVDKVYIYSTSPVKKIIGYFEYSDCLSGDVNLIWAQTCSDAGISEVDYIEYFKNHKVAYAFKLDKLVLFEDAIDPYKVLTRFHPPQSFCYIEENI